MQINYNDWRSCNEIRSYPFIDDSSLVATNKVVIPNSAIIDAAFYPADYFTGNLYLKSVDTVTGLIVVASTDGLVTLIGEYNEDKPIIFRDQRGRTAGTLVLGSDYQYLLVTSEFKPEDSTFVSSCVIPILTDCVTAIELPNGDIMTGAITVYGDNGVEVSTTTDTIKFSAIGAPVTSTCTEIGPPIKYIKLVQTGGQGGLTVSTQGTVIYLGSTVTLEERCEAISTDKVETVTTAPPQCNVCTGECDHKTCTVVSDFIWDNPVPTQKELEQANNGYVVWPSTGLLKIEPVVVDDSISKVGDMENWDLLGIEPKPLQGLKISSNWSL